MLTELNVLVYLKQGRWDLSPLINEFTGLSKSDRLLAIVMGKIVYYKDIDLLRALAVIAVVIFHFHQDWLPSGYLGVDLFFVISGFVITLQIAKRYKEGSFSISTFFQRRIKRILPLVTAVVLCLHSAEVVPWVQVFDQSSFSIPSSPCLAPPLHPPSPCLPPPLPPSPPSASQMKSSSSPSLPPARSRA